MHWKGLHRNYLPFRYYPMFFIVRSACEAILLMLLISHFQYRMLGEDS